MSFRECHSPAGSAKRERPNPSLHVSFPVLNSLDNGSDTEEEDNTEMEEYYLNRPNKVRVFDTIFGKGIRIWKSREGTVYTQIEGQAVDGEAVVSEKVEHQQILPVSSFGCHSTPISAKTFRLWTPSPCDAKNSTSLVLPSRPIQSLPSVPASVCDTRTPNDPVLPLGFAGIDLRSIYTRPFTPVPHNSKDPCPPADWPLSPSQQMPYQLTAHEFRSNDQIRDMLATEQGVRGVISDSFGSFQDQPGRFDQRPYRLLPGKGTKEKERERWVGEMDGGKKRVYHNGGLNPLRARPWLRK